MGGPVKLVVIADREFFNLNEIIHFCNANRDIEFRGVITPFHDLDDKILELIDWVKEMKHHGVAAPGNVFDDGPKMFFEASKYDFFFQLPDGREMYFLHAPYKKNMNPRERREYSEALLELLEKLDPDLIFLSNYKAFLDEIIPKTYNGQIVNVHPSFLPHNRGWKTEELALKGINPQASGYTFQVVEPEMDKGPTLFQQLVRVRSQNYESLRTETILAQCRWTPLVLGLYASDMQRKIVEGERAYEAEGRDFDPSHPDYRRMLFKHKGEFQTMETILEAPRVAQEQNQDYPAVYSFELQGVNIEIFHRLSDLEDLVKAKGGYSGARTGVYDKRSGRLQCEISSSVDITTMLGLANAFNIEVFPMPVSVVAARAEAGNGPQKRLIVSPY